MLHPQRLSKKWPTKKLGEVATFLDGKRKPVKESERKPGPYPYYGANGLQGTIDGYIFDEPIILLAEDGGHFRQPERGIAYKVTGKSWVNNHAHVLKPKNDSVDIDFLLYHLRHYDVTPFISGSTRDKLTKGSAEEIPILLPPLADQKQIVKRLSVVSQAQAIRQTSIADADSYLRSIFIEMFGDPVSNPKNWPMVKLESISSICRGRFSPRPRNDPAYYGGSFPFIQTGDISNSKYRLKSWHQTLNEKGIKVSKEFKTGTVVVAIVGATIGATSILEIDAYAPDSVIGIVVNPQKASNVYIEFLLRFFRPVFIAQAPATARANINLDTLKPLMTQVPPLELQQKFEDQVNATLKLQSSMYASQIDFATLFQSLLSETYGEMSKGNLQ